MLYDTTKLVVALLANVPALGWVVTEKPGAPAMVTLGAPVRVMVPVPMFCATKVLLTVPVPPPWLPKLVPSAMFVVVVPSAMVMLLPITLMRGLMSIIIVVVDAGPISTPSLKATVIVRLAIFGVPRSLTYLISLMAAI